MTIDMKYFLVTMLIHIVLAQRDPSKICLPDKYETSVYDFNKNDFGIASVDFTKNLSGIAFSKAGISVIYDLTAMKGYYSTTLTGACSQFVMDPNQIVVQCLPANAKPLTNATKIIGMVSSGGIKIVLYEIPLSADAAIRVAYTDTTPALPVIRELIGTTSKVTSNALFFTNPSLTSNTFPLAIPSVCPPATTVG